jgi:DNA-binding winged helix-turn-helix (wHTH) protein
MASEPRYLYEFGEFRLDPEESVLLRDAQPIPLAPKALEVLIFLVQNNGRLVDKDEILKNVWPDTVVEEGNLNFAIHQARKALQDDSSNPRYIKTVLKRGYRFIADVRVLEGRNGNALKTSSHNGTAASPNHEPAETTVPPVKMIDRNQAAHRDSGLKRWVIAATVVVSLALIGSALIISNAWLRARTPGKDKQTVGVRQHSGVQLEAPLDEAEAKAAVKESQLFETLTVYTDPKGFDRKQLSKYWVPEAEGGKEIKEVEASVNRLLEKHWHYAVESKCELFEFRYARVYAPGDYAEVGTIERWHLPLHNDDESPVLERNFNLGPIPIDYGLKKINGVWLIQETTVPRPRKQ